MVEYCGMGFPLVPSHAFLTCSQKILWKYGLAPIRTQRLMKSTVGKFLKLYEPPFFPFRSLSSRAADLELLPVTSMTGEQYLAANRVSQAQWCFIDVR